jgi:osmotically inducible lipoprotein OsmB
MNALMNTFLKIATGALLATLFVGCGTVQERDIGLVTGGVVGGVAGHAIGGSTGAVIGAVGGGYIGSKIGESAERSRYYHHYHHRCYLATDGYYYDRYGYRC